MAKKKFSLSDDEIRWGVLRAVCRSFGRPHPRNPKLVARTICEKTGWLRPDNQDAEWSMIFRYATTVAKIDPQKVMEGRKGLITKRREKKRARGKSVPPLFEGPKTNKHGTFGPASEVRHIDPKEYKGPL